MTINRRGLFSCLAGLVAGGATIASGRSVAGEIVSRLGKDAVLGSRTRHSFPLFAHGGQFPVEWKMDVDKIMRSRSFEVVGEGENETIVYGPVTEGEWAS